MKFFTKLKIKKQIGIMISILLTFQLGLFVASFFALKNINSNLTKVFEQRLPAIDNLVQGDRDFQQALVAERTLLLDNLSKETIKAQVKDYKVNRKQVIDRFEVYAKTASTKKELELVNKFRAAYTNWEKTSDAYFKLGEDGVIGNKTDITTKSIGEIASAFESSRDNLDALQEEIQTLARFEYNSAEKNYKNTNLLMYIVIGFSFFVSAIVGFVCIRSINRKINDTIESLNNESEQLDTISTELAGQAQQLASSSVEQSSCVTQTSSSLHEISQMVKTNTDSAVESSELVSNGKRDLDKSLNLISELNNKIDLVNATATELANKVNDNHKKFSQILTVFNNVQEKTSVINDIVFQTKLLSFNASVEAARAGEQGKGFAVVAEEVGNLAEMSGKSADEISTLLSESLDSVNTIITNSQTEVNQAVGKNENIIAKTISISKECEVVLREVESMFDRVTDSSAKIANASKEQTLGVEEINSAVVEISNSNEQTTDAASQVEERSGKLVGIVGSLHESIETLKKAV